MYEAAGLRELTMRLSVLDQSTLSEGSSPTDAIAGTVEVAKQVDSFGYERIWVSEHHNMSILQGSTPEVLLSSIGAQTRRIRIGSGGVMLPNHSAYHVAENFRMLEALYPGRVDCGIGRASGGDSYSRSLLNAVPGTADSFPNQIDQLDRHFHDECERAFAMPKVSTVPPMWLLSAGSNPSSGLLAAEKGMGFAVALFINPEASVESVRQYRQRFRPSREFPEPKVILAVNAVCAEDEGKLLELKKASDFFRLMRDSGRYPAEIPSPATLSKIDFGQRERSYLHKIANREVVGHPLEVRDQLLERASRYDADEVMLTTMSYAVEDKIEMFRLLGRAFRS